MKNSSVLKFGVLLVSLSVTFLACGTKKAGQGSETEAAQPEIQTETQAEAPAVQESGLASESEGEGGEASKADDLKGMFGENCIEEQTFEVQLSGYEKKVWFVPYAPSQENDEFHIQIWSDNEVLTEITPYVPQGLAGEDFVSLDAVSFYDVNYDGNTDIVMVETYGGTGFAAVYYGALQEEGEGGNALYFVAQEKLSDNISEKVSPLTIPEIRSFLSDGKKNGEFSDYREAYEMVSRLCGLESSEEVKYNLIYFDEDDIPELAAGVSGYYMSLYTWRDGNVYTLMDHWGYGAMGNAGYEYCPKKNSLRNDNSDFAGAIVYTTYMKIGGQCTLEPVVQIETYNFDDVNENGIPDEDEMDSFGRYGESRIDGVTVTDEECAAYSAGEYEYIEVTMSAEELKLQM